MTKPISSKQAMCQAGERLFAQYGFSAVGIKMILDDVGIPKGSFYHYFKSKEAFAISVAEHYVEHTLNKISFDADADFKHNLSAMLTAYHQLVDDMMQVSPAKGCVLTNMMIEANDNFTDLSAALAVIHRNWIAQIAEVFLQGQQQGFIGKERDTMFLANVFWNQWQGAVLRLKLDGNKQAAKRTLVQSVQLMTR